MPRERVRNGGFPEPPAGEPVRVLSCPHLTCGADTRVRVPRSLPLETVRHVVCSSCGRSFECHLAEEVEPSRWRDLPPGRAWRLVSVPIAAAAVVGGLVLIRTLA